jgi:hypothetical protein
MWGVRYWGAAYWGVRYWGKVGATPPGQLILGVLVPMQRQNMMPVLHTDNPAPALTGG